jgi:hypothetical protein
MVKIFGRIGCVLTFVFFFASAFAASDLRNAGKNDIIDNPFIAYGVNPVTQVVTGYLAALRTSPAEQMNVDSFFWQSKGRKSI